MVAADKAMRRDGRFLELLGTYDPLTNPATVKLDLERVKYWIGVGAETSDSAASIIDTQLPGYLGELTKKQEAKIVSRRRARKQRAKARAKTAKKA